MKDNRWRTVVGVAIVTLLAGCVMAVLGQGFFAGVLHAVFALIVWFGVLENPNLRG
jgi:hypothetical protein